MKFQVIHSTQIDAKKWNHRIVEHKSDIYNEYHFLNAVTLNHWYGIVWGDYDKVLPFYRKKKWGIIPYITMPPFCQKFDTNALTEDEWKDAINYFRSRHFLIEYRMSDAKNDTKGIEKRDNYVLSLHTKSIEEIRSQYTSLLKKNIAKASSISIIQGSKADVSRFFQTHSLFQKLVLKRHAKAFDNLFSAELLQHYCAEIDHEIIAILCFAEWNNTLYNLFPYSSALGKKHQAMSILIDYLIDKTSSERFDFEGSSIPSIAHFYKQFGAEKTTYYSLKWHIFSTL